MTAYSMVVINTLPAKLGQRCGEVWRGRGRVEVSGVVLPTVPVWGGEGGGGGDNAVVDYGRV